MAIILNVDMPDCCYKCPCFDGNDGSSHCQAIDNGPDVGREVLYPNTRPAWCPICGVIGVDLPKPHDCCLWDAHKGECKAGITNCPDNDSCYAFD